MKYDDAGRLWDPLRERKEPSKKDRIVIHKMKLMGRYPVPEILISMPDNYFMMMDSLIRQAYNSDDQAEWIEYRPDVKQPQNSIESRENYDFDSSESSTEDVQKEDDDAAKKDKANKEKKKPTKISKKGLDKHGFDMD